METKGTDRIKELLKRCSGGNGNGVRVFLKNCGECEDRTVHTKKRTFDEVAYVTTVVERCEICGDVSEYKINNNTLIKP